MTAGCTFSCRPRWTEHSKHEGKDSKHTEYEVLNEPTRERFGPTGICMGYIPVELVAHPY
jgi:hypothetical protein